MVKIDTAEKHNAMIDFNNDIIACLKKGFPFSLSGSNSYRELDILENYIDLGTRYGIPEVKSIRQEFEDYNFEEESEVINEFVDELERILLEYVDFSRIEIELGHATVRRSNCEATQQMIVLLTRNQKSKEDRICSSCGYLVKAGQPFWLAEQENRMFCRSCDYRILAELEEE